MRSYTHVAGAVFFYLLIAYLLNIDNLLLNLIFTAWISLLPDILDKLLGKHRGMGHSILWLIPLALVGFYSPGLAAALLVGFSSHIFLDSFTVHGSPLLYPIKKTSFVCLNRKKRIKTGTNQEKALFVFFLFVLIPLFLFIVNAGYYLDMTGSEGMVFAVNENLNNSSNNTDTVKYGINLNLNLNSATNKNITILKGNENFTTILIKDIEKEG